MDQQDQHTTQDGPRRGRVLAAGLAAAALAIPGGALISNAFAADGATSAPAATQSQDGSSTAPVQDAAPDGDRDCPEEDGAGSGSGSGSGSDSGTSSGTSAQTAL